MQLLKLNSSNRLNFNIYFMFPVAHFLAFYLDYLGVLSHTYLLLFIFIELGLVIALIRNEKCGIRGNLFFSFFAVYWEYLAKDFIQNIARISSIYRANGIKYNFLKKSNCSNSLIENSKKEDTIVQMEVINDNNTIEILRSIENRVTLNAQSQMS